MVTETPTKLVYQRPDSLTDIPDALLPGVHTRRRPPAGCGSPRRYEVTGKNHRGGLGRLFGIRLQLFRL